MGKKAKKMWIVDGSSSMSNLGKMEIKKLCGLQDIPLSFSSLKCSFICSLVSWAGIIDKVEGSFVNFLVCIL